MKTRLVSTLFLVFLSGCTLKFTKPGLNQQEFARDWTECRAQMGQTYGGTPGILLQNEFLTMCMEGRGYTLDSGPAKEPGSFCLKEDDQERCEYGSLSDCERFVLRPTQRCASR